MLRVVQAIGVRGSLKDDHHPSRDRFEAGSHGARDTSPDRRGQVVDVALFESVFNVLEAVVPEHDRFGAVRGPSGTTITGVAPTNVYACRDGAYVVGAVDDETISNRQPTEAASSIIDFAASMR